MKIKISACTAKGSHIENQDFLCATGLCPEQQTSFWADRKEVEVPFLYAAVSDGIGSGAAGQRQRNGQRTAPKHPKNLLHGTLAPFAPAQPHGLWS